MIKAKKTAKVLPYQCDVCGRFISYADLDDKTKINIGYACGGPVFTHLHCDKPLYIEARKDEPATGKPLTTD